MTEGGNIPALQELASEAAQTVRRSLPQLVGYEILFRLASTLLLGPLASAVVVAFVSFSGTPAVSNFDLAGFALSPWGLLTLAAAGTVHFALLMAEAAGFQQICGSRLQGEPCKATAAFAAALWRLPRLGGLALWQLLAYAAVLAPFLGAAALTYRGLLSEHDINFYLKTKPPEFYTAVAIGVLLAVGAALPAACLYLRWCFALPILLFEETSARTALARSWQLTKTRLAAVARPLLAWAGIVLLMGVLLGAAMNLLADAVLSVTGQNLAWTVTAVGLLLATNAIMLTIAALVSVAGHAALVIHLYAPLTSAGRLARLPASWPAEEPGSFSWQSGLWMGSAALAVLGVLFSWGAVESLSLERDVQITAHRGSSKRAPENTLAAIRAAIEDGADYAEIDVQETADGVIVVMHDADLARIAGVPRSIWEIRYEELKELDAGSWFGPEFAGERVPSLQEVIELARGKIRLNIELKLNGHQVRLEERVVQVIRDHRFEKECVVTSLDYQAVQKTKSLAPELSVGLILSAALGKTTGLESDFFSVNQNLVDRTLVAGFHEQGRAVHVWTVNDRDDALRLIDLGVDNFITDEPRQMRRILQEYHSQSDAEKILIGFHRWLAE